MGEEFPVYGPVQARERAPRRRFVTRPGFEATNARLAVAPGGERIAASITGPADDSSIEVRRRLPGRDWSEPQVVATGQVRPYDNLAVEVAPTGEAVVWWTDERVSTPQRRSALMVAVRPAGATTFSPAEPLAEGRLSPAAVQFDADGNAVAAWVDRDTGALRIARRPAGSVWNAPESFAVPGRSVVDDFDAPRLAVAPNGRAVVTWSVGVDGQEFSGGIAAIAGSATGPFGTPVVLSDRGSASAAATDGRLSAITWAENPGAKGRVRAVLLARGADLASAPERVVSGTAVPYGVGQVTVAKGRATFAWLRRVAGPRVVEARTATIDGRFTRAQTLSSRRETASNVTITTSSRGEPWVAWAARSAAATTATSARARRRRARGRASSRGPSSSCEVSTTARPSCSRGGAARCSRPRRAGTSGTCGPTANADVGGRGD